MRREANDKTRNRWLTAIGLIALTLLTAMVFAEEQPAVVFDAQPVAAEQSAAPEQPAAPAQPEMITPAPSAQSLQTIAFKKDMPIADALKMLAQMYQKNIVPSAKVNGNVTVGTLYDVTFEEALQAILGTHKYDVKGNFIRVYTMEEYKADKTRLDRDTITLYYINSEEAGKLAKPLLSEMGQIGITTAAAKDTKAGDGGNSLAIRDMLVVSDYPENIKAIREMIQKVDVAPPQILIEVTILEATLNETTQFGIDFDTMGGLVSTIGDEGISQRGMAGMVTPGFQGAPTTSGLNIGILNDKVRVFIRALEEITDTTVLANPKIMALNKQAGSLIIGREDGYLTTTTVSDGGNKTQQVDFLKSGTILEFRPFIGDDGLIRMELRPEQSTGQVVGGLPNKATTEVKSNVMVRDGKTIVLGGLFQEKTSRTTSQVPLLGDIPFVGMLFKSTNDQSIRTELIVLLTPHIITEPEQADGATRMDDVERLSSQARQNLSWLSRARLDEIRYANAVKLYNEGNKEAALAELDGYWFWDADRNYLDATRLKERIIRETQPDQVNQIERIMLGNLEKEESGKWQRR
jgi:type II secretory pathway component GspD/PulD (secretin)